MLDRRLFFYTLPTTPWTVRSYSPIYPVQKPLHPVSTPLVDRHILATRYPSVPPSGWMKDLPLCRTVDSVYSLLTGLMYLRRDL